jgi:hypothetical protein
MSGEYIIQEFDGRFSIMVKTEETKGMLWWKRIETNWVRANAFGSGSVYGYFSLPPLASFKTLEEAKEQIKSWQKGIIIHQVE